MEVTQNVSGTLFHVWYLRTIVAGYIIRDIRSSVSWGGMSPQDICESWIYHKENPKFSFLWGNVNLQLQP